MVTGMRNKELCGTAAGYNALGADHRRDCSVCREAAHKWATGFNQAKAGGYHLQWAKQNPPRSVRA